MIIFFRNQVLIAIINIVKYQLPAIQLNCSLKQFHISIVSSDNRIISEITLMLHESDYYECLIHSYINEKLFISVFQ